MAWAACAPPPDDNQSSCTTNGTYWVVTVCATEAFMQCRIVRSLHCVLLIMRQERQPCLQMRNGGKHSCQKNCRTAVLVMLTYYLVSASTSITMQCIIKTRYLPSKQFGQWLLNSKQPQGIKKNEQGHIQTQPAQGIQTWSKVKSDDAHVRSLWQTPKSYYVWAF